MCDREHDCEDGKRANEHLRRRRQATSQPRTILKLLGDIQRMNGEALAYQTRIEERCRATG